MKDAHGHGSNGKGGGAAQSFDQELSNFATHQHGIISATSGQPNAEGADLYRQILAHAQSTTNPEATPYSGFSRNDLRGMYE